MYTNISYKIQYNHWNTNSKYMKIPYNSMTFNGKTMYFQKMYINHYNSMKIIEKLTKNHQIYMIM